DAVSHNMRSTVYVASKTIHSELWQCLRDFGRLNIISSWIDLGGDEPDNATDWATLWTVCIHEASLADCTLVYLLPGECAKGSLIEMGCALANHHPVFLVNLSGHHIDAAHHPLVWQCASLEEAIEKISDVAPEPLSLRHVWPSSGELPVLINN